MILISEAYVIIIAYFRCHLHVSSVLNYTNKNIIYMLNQTYLNFTQSDRKHIFYLYIIYRL